MKLLPLNAAEIYVNWRRGECGIGVTARTDEGGQGYIGLYPLDWEGQSAGFPTYFRRSRLMADIVVGPVWTKPLVIFIDAEVTARGLDLRLCLPTSLAPHGDYPRHFSARWGDPKPRFDIVPAAVKSWSVNPLSSEE